MSKKTNPILEIGEFYHISILDTKKVTIKAFGEHYRTYSYDDILVDGPKIVLYRSEGTYIFNYEKSAKMYRLCDITHKEENYDENIEDNEEILLRDPFESHSQRIKRLKRTQYEKIRTYFKANWDDLIYLKRYCLIEGVQKIENIRFEIRRMMNFGEIYRISLEELAEILREFGFIVRN